MIDGLKQRTIQKLPDRVRLDGRVLLLAEDPALVRSQLDGEDLSWSQAIKLRDNISTDEITPAYICYYFDETLGDFPYLGLKCGEEFPITRGAVKSCKTDDATPHIRAPHGDTAALQQDHDKDDQPEYGSFEHATKPLSTGLERK